MVSHWLWHIFSWRVYPIVSNKQYEGRCIRPWTRLQVRPSPIYPYPFPKNCGSPAPCNCLSPRTRLSHYRNQTRRRRDVGDKLYLLGCHPIKGSLHSTVYTAPGLVLPSRVNTLRIYSGGTCCSVSTTPLQVWLVLISMSRFRATCCNIRRQMVPLSILIMLW